MTLLLVLGGVCQRTQVHGGRLHARRCAWQGRLELRGVSGLGRTFSHPGSLSVRNIGLGAGMSSRPPRINPWSSISRRKLS